MGRFKMFIRITKRYAWDFFNSEGKYWLAFITALFAMGLSHLGLDKYALKYAMWTHRVSGSARCLKIVSEKLESKPGLFMSMVNQTVDKKGAAGRSIVIRWPQFEGDQVTSKGILIITFTDTFSYYLCSVDVDLMSQYFAIVLEPSWSGYLDQNILAWAVTTKSNVFVQASEKMDRAAISSLCNNLVPLSIGASDWVDCRKFYPVTGEKIYDSVYVANTSPIKRIHAYFKAINRIIQTGNKGYRAALICSSWGGGMEEVIALRKWYRVEDNCELVFDLSQNELNVLLGKAKCNVLLSHKEGSNRSLFESMFAGTPVVALSRVEGPNKCYINEYTGVLCNESHLPNVLNWMSDNYLRFSPDAWARNNISPVITTKKLVQYIDDLEGCSSRFEVGLSGPKDAYVKVNSPEVSYLGVNIDDVSKVSADVISLFEKGVKSNRANIVGNLMEIFNRHASQYRT